MTRDQAALAKEIEKVNAENQPLFKEIIDICKGGGSNIYNNLDLIISLCVQLKENKIYSDSCLIEMYQRVFNIKPKGER